MASLLLALHPLAASSQPVLSLDFDERVANPATNAINTMPGFESFLIDSVGGITAIQTAPITRTFGSISVTLSGSGVTPGHDDRLRAVPTNNATFTDSALLKDFVFSRDTTGNDGLDVSIAGLEASRYYRCVIWSYDNGSGGSRVSDWFANGTLVKENYTFDGRVLPANNLSYRFSFVVASDAAGILAIQGRRKPSTDTAGAATLGVFLNGLQVEPTFPEPAITIPPAGGTRRLGDRITFSPLIDGVAPITYRWLKGETEIPGATSPTLTLSDLSVEASGDYRVVAQNAFGTTTSAPATLTVLPDPAPAVANGLVSHWPMDTLETRDSGSFTPDLYSHNDMALVGDPLFGFDGAFGNALDLNGTSQYGYRSAGFPIYNNPAFTVSLWVKGSGVGQSDRRFFSESSTNAPNPLFNLGTDSAGASGIVRVFIRNDAGATLLARNSTRTALDGAWHHVVWTENNGQGKLYIDGQLDESDFTYTRGPLTLNQTTVGAILRNTVGNYFAGSVDDVAVWNRAITYSEIQSVRTNGIPAPVTIVPPEITVDPASQSVLTGSRVRFDFAAIGTGPLQIQWRKGGEDITDETNATLVLPSVTLDDAGDYDVVVSNAGGTDTSKVATLTVTLRPPPPEILAVDFNNLGPDDSSANTEDGFNAFSLPAFGTGPVTRSFGGADVTLTAIGTTMESRKRTTPVNAPPFTEERLLQDFIFARDSDPAHGLDVEIGFMEPSTPYRISIWSFDTGSPNPRISDWTVNGLLVMPGWTFNGNTLPADNNTYRFDFDTASDATGKILIQGRRALGGGTFNVFINALKIAKRQLRVTRIDYTFEIILTIDALNPAAPHRILEKRNLTDTEWTTVSGVFFQGAGGNTLTATFPAPDVGPRFYMVVQDP